MRSNTCWDAANTEELQDGDIQHLETLLFSKSMNLVKPGMVFFCFCDLSVA
jgi:hypothetical protein